MNEKPELSGRSVAVFGATGCVGRWVAVELDRRGARLELFARDPEKASRWAVRARLRSARVHALDLRRNTEPGETLIALKPDLAFNLAGYGVDPGERDPQTFRLVNVELVRRLAAAMAALPPSDWRGSRLVHVGSAAEYGNVGGDLAEGGPAAPVDDYGRTKLDGTLALSACCRESGLAGLTARLFTVYGAGEHPGRLLPSLVRLATEGGVLELTAGDQMRDFAFVGDLAEALVELARVSIDRGQVLNLASGRMMTVRRFVERVAAVLGIESDRLLFGARPSRPFEMRHDAPDLSRLLGLGITPPTDDVESGVRRSLDAEMRMSHD